MKENQNFVLGLDYGTDSVRAILVDAANGAVAATSVAHYSRWRDGLFCDAAENRFRQHPLDYVEGLEKTIKDCLKQAGPAAAAATRAISVDTTGSTPVAVDSTGTPLALTTGFEQNPNAMFVLWKDHTGVKEAEEINALSKRWKIDYTKYVGGIYSSEWFWAKLLHVLRADDAVAKACYSWVEHCDWIPFLLSGGTEASKIYRGRCSAGHKALWAKEFEGLPADEFFAALDPKLKGFRARLFKDTYTADQPVGTLSRAWADKLGLSSNVILGAGAFDAHMGAVGGQIEPYHLSKVMGTSTCDMLVAPNSDIEGRLVKGICGQVDGSVIPGMCGLEAGQSAFGDTYAWFRDLLAWPLQLLGSRGVESSVVEQLRGEIVVELTKQAQELQESDELAVDWLNGRRTPDADQRLKAAMTGLSLGSTAPKIFRALVESTCFGAKAIVERFQNEGVPVKGLIGLGGVALKSPYIMQMMADVINMPLRIHRSEQTCALGAAMFAATAAKLYPKVENAMTAMGQGFASTYTPRKELVTRYQTRYNRYLELGGFVQAGVARNDK